MPVQAAKSDGMAPSIDRVSDVIRSLSGEVVKTFDSPVGSLYTRVTIRIRTRQVRWEPNGGAKVWTRAANGTVGWYTWRWELRGEPDGKGRRLIVTADNSLMLNPVFAEANERDPLGRLLNEALLYHELLHGQLLMDAMENPEWRERLCRTGVFDASARDSDHAVIHDLERQFLRQRAGENAISIDPPRTVGSDSTFTVIAGRIPDGFRGGVSVSYQLMADSNVRNLTVSLPKTGPQKGKVILQGELIDPRRGGFLLAVLDPPSDA